MSMLMDMASMDFTLKGDILHWVEFGAFLVLAIIVGVKLRRHGAHVVVATIGLLCFAICFQDIELTLRSVTYYSAWSGFYKHKTAWQTVWLVIKLAVSGLFFYGLIVGLQVSPKSSCAQSPGDS